MTIWGVFAVLFVFFGLCYVIRRTYLNIQRLNTAIEANNADYKPHGDATEDDILAQYGNEVVRWERYIELHDRFETWADGGEHEIRS